MSEEVRAEVRLHTMEHYVRTQRNIIALWIVDRPIFKLCQDARRRKGTMHR